jgi:hypothetical protein
VNIVPLLFGEKYKLSRVAEPHLNDPEKERKTKNNPALFPAFIPISLCQIKKIIHNLHCGYNISKIMRIRLRNTK